jgi:pimeloyl-ACP methyl ester carboxylesterase
VGTAYGSTHIITTGDNYLPPLFLFHAMGLNATMWLPNIEELSNHFHLYMVDAIGDLGRSNLFDFNKVQGNGEDYSRWFYEILDRLQIEKTYIAGSSYGGWITLNCAVYAPERVKGIALLGPMDIEVVIFPDSGHLLNREEVEEVNKKIISFFKE